MVTCAEVNALDSAYGSAAAMSLLWSVVMMPEGITLNSSMPSYHSEVDCTFTSAFRSHERDL